MEMCSKIIFLSVIALVVLQIETSNARETECRIYNDFYKEYLYASYKFLGLGTRRGAYLWKELNSFTQQLTHGRYSAKTGFNGDDLSGIWYFEPVRGYKSTFFLRNKKYPNEYLSGSESYHGLFSKKNRKVHVQKMKNDEEPDQQSAFMWSFKPVPRTHLYQIWNVKYSEPLYAQNLINYDDKKHNNGRSIALWHTKQPHTDQFDWILKCNDNIMPLIEE